MADMHEQIGARIREVRKQVGMQQEELAQRIGLTRASISNYERGAQNLTVESLYAICAALQVEPQTLLPHLHVSMVETQHWFAGYAVFRLDD